MALENSNDMVMPVSPMNGGYGNGTFGNDGWWIILLFILLGRGGYGYGGSGMGAEVQSGFNQAALQNGLTDIQQSICNGFAGAEASASARQMAAMNQAFAAQTAVTGAITDLASQQANCCCENRLAVANLQSAIAAENCADRAAISDGIRDILVSQSNGIQKILDTMCQDKIDAKNEKIADLERQLTMADLAASQNAQTAAILANNEAQTAALENYLNPPARPAYIVQNPNCCQGQWSGCSCGIA